MAMTDGRAVEKKGARRTVVPPLGQAALVDPAAFMQNFSAARQAYEKTVTELRAKREELEARAKQEIEELEKTFAGQVETSREELNNVCPLSADDVHEVPYLRAAYSDRMAAVMAVLSLFSYIDFAKPEFMGVLNEVIGHGDLKLVKTYDSQDTEAILVEGDKFLAIVFRGTTTKRDRATDMSIGFEKVELRGHPKSVAVHKGFYQAFSYVEDAIHADLKASPDKPIYIAGHSLGGALALVASAAFGGCDHLGPRLAAVYTFGSPRVGGKSFGICVKAPHYRIVNQFDIVPMVPPSWLFGYVHSGERLMLKDKGKRAIRQQPGVFALFDSFQTFVSALIGTLLWPLNKQTLFLAPHDISRYASRLQGIAGIRRKWS
jgi:triacylglycerol lipase